MSAAIEEVALRRPIHFFAVAILAAFLLSCQGESPEAPVVTDPEHVAAVEEWAANREARLP